jgi:hypothetical protein
MKYAIIALTLLATSCSSQWLARMYERECLTYLENGIYLKNANTGLCVWVGNSYRSMNSMCVPCDSLKIEAMIVALANKKLTRFMQACDVFESFKVVLGDIVSFDSAYSPQYVFDTLKERGEIPICVIGETEVFNGGIKAVSDGARWTTIEKFTETLKQDTW